jgi:hypothetical protein
VRTVRPRISTVAKFVICLSVVELFRRDPIRSA